MFEYAFSIDRHQPFICAGVRELIERISPDYLTYELITNNLAQHRSFLSEQIRALNA
ncbi:hypothetical protein SDC9_173184 [bioreactor metagenome]|uniref:Uncharacterized protein n=1 Tax=bioreactor metagenome TaxID=1076179 RepID=A0A645GIY0_9ZZZZ